MSWANIIKEEALISERPSYFVHFIFFTVYSLTKMVANVSMVFKIKQKLELTQKHSGYGILLYKEKN